MKILDECIKYTTLSGLNRRFKPRSWLEPKVQATWIYLYTGLQASLAQRRLAQRSGDYESEDSPAEVDPKEPEEEVIQTEVGGASSSA